MPKWNIDVDHSVAAFSVKHMMITDVHGQFNRLSGAIVFNPADIAGTTIQLEMDASGIYTGIKKRDDHLRSPEFFDAEKYPVISFKSTRCEISAFNSCKVSGDLTIHGITKSLTAVVEFLGPVKSPFDETSMGFTAKAVINQGDFGLLWNMPLENGGLLIGGDVHIFLDIEADLVEG
ncbi:MAG: YceI family protein [Nitrospirae bacterium]|nr:YceI family protein [Nitrospirota bacterium]